MPENNSIDVDPTSALAPGAKMPLVSDEVVGSRVPPSFSGVFDPIEAITRARQANIPESSDKISLKETLNKIIATQKEVDKARLREQQDEAQATSNFSTNVMKQIDARNQAFQNEPLPMFAPTQENAQSLAGLFGLLGVVGAMTGKGGGQQSAIASMNAMTGMMKGWQQGRADLYQQEKDKFEKNFQTVKAKHEQLEKDFAAAMEKAKYDLQGATAEAKLAAIKQGSDVLSKSIELNGLIRTAEMFRQNVEDREKLEDFVSKAYLERQNRLESAGKPLVAKGDDGKFYYVNPVTGKALTDDEGNKLQAPAPRTEGIKGLPLDKTIKYQGKLSLLDSLEELKNDFKDNYQLGFLGVGAEMERGLRMRFATEESDPAVTWWANNDLLQAPERHALFGATLTGNELQNFKKFSPTETDGAATIRDKLKNQIDYLKSRIKTDENAFEMSGIKIPEKQKLNWIKSVNINSENWSKENLEAYEWAQQHPDDPRAKKILETIGLK